MEKLEEEEEEEEELEATNYYVLAGHTHKYFGKAKCLPCQQVWILSFYCFASAFQALLWMTYASVDSNISYTYLGFEVNSTNNVTTHDNEYDTTWILNEGPIGYLLTVFTVPLLLLHPKGLRYSILLSAVMCFVAGFLRMVPAFISPNPEGRGQYLWLVYVAQAINAAAAPYTQSLPTQLSQTWFGLKNRALATSIGRVSNAGGRALGYFIGPLMVEQTGTLNNLMWFEAALGVVLFISVLTYFPSAPKVAPTKSAGVFRARVVQSDKNKVTEKNKGSQICVEIKQILCSKTRTIFLLLGFGVQMGAYGAWSGVLIQVVTAIGMTSQEASAIGTYNTLAGVVGGILIGVMVTTEALAARLRLALITFSIAGAVTFALVTIALPPLKLLSMSNTAIVILCTFGGLFRGMLDPLFFEYATEISYPSSPAVVGGVLTVWTHLVMVIVLSLPASLVNDIAMYLMPIALLITAGLVALVKGKYHRRIFDTSK